MLVEDARCSKRHSLQAAILGGYKLLCKLCRHLPPLVMGDRFTVFGQAGHADPLDSWPLLLIKAGVVETKPGPTTTPRQVWI